MAEAYGNVVQHWQSRIVAWTENETDTTITIVADCYWHSIKWGYDVAARGYADISGTNGGWARFTAYSGTGASNSMRVQQTRKTVTKNQNGYNVRVEGVVEVTGGYHNGRSAASVNIWVPARTRKPHGKPSFSTSSNKVHYGDEVTLSWNKAATQGNANFDHFELWQGTNTKQIYKGNALSYKLKPSDYTGAQGGDVKFSLWEYHEWYGTYPYTGTELTINVQSGVITAYNDIGIKCTGLVTAYDGKGKARPVLINAYDSLGRKKSVV